MKLIQFIPEIKIIPNLSPKNNEELLKFLEINKKSLLKFLEINKKSLLKILNNIINDQLSIEELNNGNFQIDLMDEGIIYEENTNGEMEGFVFEIFLPQNNSNYELIEISGIQLYINY